MSKASRSSDRTPRRLAAAFALALMLFGLSVRADAQSARLLDAPRAAGTVGERYDGYAVARGAVPPDLAKLVDQVNAERRAVYQKRAQSEGAPVEAIGKIYAGEILKSAPPGTWFLGEDGQWARK